ncbi:MAG: DUF4837 family protein [Clostridium sp.]|nr:DUF4837 family protein [Bacteroides sp.]MCM1199021.1 DUF4837 family protein [Clostridium sp.]
MKQFLSIMAFAALLFSFQSCKEGTRKKALLPTISGKAGEVIVVISKGEWESSAGVELRELLATDCPFLPQKEPLYTLVNISPSAFTSIFQIHRNILIVNISNDVTEPGVVYRNDVWAQPQCVISVNAVDGDSAAQLIKDNEERILHTLEQAERDRIIANARKYEERSLPPAVIGMAGGSPHFPTGYVLKKKTRDFIWIAYETTYINQGIFIYKYPVTGEDDMSIEKIVAMRNEILQQNVPGMFENTYMTTSDVTMPGIEYIKYKGREFAEVKGFWEVHNDYMGGPFVSHSFYSKDGKDIITIEGFVYAPRYDKRHYLRQVESLLYSFEWSDGEFCK